MRGAGRIAAAFEGGGLRIMAHGVAGFPDPASSERIFRAMAESGAGLIEVQLPFSDPVADGPAIVEANHLALRSGMRRPAVLALLAGLRAATELPIVLMSYLNPLLARGLERSLEEFAEAGVDGLIVPDWPDDEPELRLGELSEAAGLPLLPLIAPSTSLERAAALASASSSPLLYAVTRLGVTGRRTELGEGVLARLAALRGRTGRRVAAGFGIREPSQLRELEGRADCAVVGTALIQAARGAWQEGGDPAAAVAGLLRELRGGG